MMRNLWSLFFALALCFGLFRSAHAQANEVFCGEIEAEDCAILRQSQEVGQAAAQYAFEANIVTTLTSIPGLEEDITVPVNVRGFLGSDQQLMADRELLLPLTREEANAAIVRNPQLLVDLVQGLDMDLTFTTNLPFDVARDLKLLQAPILEGRQFYTTEVRLVDGGLYLDQTYVTPFGDFPRGWLEFPVMEALDQAIASGLFEVAARQLQPDRVDGGLVMRASLSEALQSIFGDQQLLNRFSTIRRGEDGAGARTFITEIDWIAMVQSPEFEQAVLKQAQANALGQSGPTAAELEQQIKMLRFMAPMLLQGLTTTTTQTIDLDTYYRTAESINFDWDLKTVLQLSAMSAPLPAAPDPATAESKFSLSVDIDYTDWATEQVDTVAVPEVTAKVPLDYLLGNP